MSNDAPSERRRQQNRESQRRYRQRQKADSREQALESEGSYRRQISQLQPAPVSSQSSNLSWPGHIFDQEALLARGAPPTCQAAPPGSLEGGEMGFAIPRERSPHAHAYLYGMSTPYPGIAAIRPQSMTNDDVRSDLDPLLPSANSLDPRQLDALLETTLPQQTPVSGTLGLAFPNQAMGPPEWVLSPQSSSHQMCPSTSKSPATRQWNQRVMGSVESFSDTSEAQPSSRSESPPVNSRAVEMITEVETLYDFGVSMGILPRDRVIQLSLRKMKLRFMSLSPPGSDGLARNSVERSSEDSDISYIKD